MTQQQIKFAISWGVCVIEDNIFKQCQYIKAKTNTIPLSVNEKKFIN